MSTPPSKRYSPFNSLIGRFVFASLILLPLFISISGTLLINSFEHSQQRAEQEKLQAHLYVLLSVAELEQKKLMLPETLTEPRFNQQNSGLYGAIYNADGKELWRSNSASLFNAKLYDTPESFKVGNKSYSQMSDDGVTLNWFSHDIEWYNEDDSITPLRFVIASDNSVMAAEINSYQNRLWQWLSIMGGSLIVIQILIMKWGLQPLKRLSKQLNALQENKIQQLDNNYPTEVEPVIENFNTILVYEKEQRERYRNTMSDLAHSLKTPLAVIQSQMTDEDSSAKKIDSNSVVNDQLARINQIISHQLKRAVIRVNQNVIAHQADKVSIKAMINRLIKILDKVYSEKNIVFTNLVNDEDVFFGDEADLLEVLGNLIDNACKYGKDSITISTIKDNKGLELRISDNGPGIPEEQYSTLLTRGARGDTAQAGQGIGLSVAVDIISSYGGGLTVQNNIGAPHLTGACFCVTLPSPLSKV
ncbi:MAG: ATP-binding protein [Cellvibrionaceae bacterium]